MIDIYFDENYGKLYEEIENGKSEVFEYKTNYGHIRHMFIKREIPIRAPLKTSQKTYKMR